MKSYQINKIIDSHIEKYEKIRSQYDIGDENETISFCNTICKELNTIKKEVELFEMVRDNKNPMDVLDILRKVNVNEDFIKLMSKLIVEEEI